jgi:hypothetical protein
MKILSALKLNNFVVPKDIQTFLKKSKFKVVYSLYFKKSRGFNYDGLMDWLLVNRSLFISPHDFLSFEYEKVVFYVPALKCRDYNINALIKKYPFKVKNIFNGLDYLLIPALSDATHPTAPEFKYYQEFKKDLFFKIYGSQYEDDWYVDPRNCDIVDRMSIDNFIEDKEKKIIKRTKIVI